MGALERVHEAPDELALTRRAWQRRELAVSRGKSGVERRARPLQSAVHRYLAAVEYAGHLRCAEAEYVAQHEHRALARRQVLKPGRERECQRLPGLVARFRPGRGVRQIFEQSVGVRLEPGWLGPAGGLGRLERGTGGVRQLMAAVPGVAQRVQAAIGRDAVEPGAHGCSLLELLKPAPGRQQGRS